MGESPQKLARARLRLDDLDGASRLVETEIDLVSDQGTGSDIWGLRFVRAEIIRLRGKPKEALEYLEFHCSVSPPDKADIQSQAELRMHRGYHMGLMARFRAGHELLDEAEALTINAKLLELWAEVCLRQAMILFLEKRYAASVRAYRLVMALAEELGGWYFRAMALWGIGKNSMIQRHYEEAMPWLEESLRIFEGARAWLSVATVWSEMGVCRLGSGNDEDALCLFQKSAQICFESGAVHNYHVALANIGNVHLQRRDFLAALSYYQKALTLAREIRDPVSVKKWTYNIRLTYARILLAVDERHPRTI